MKLELYWCYKCTLCPHVCFWMELVFASATYSGPDPQDYVSAQHLLLQRCCLWGTQPFSSTRKGLIGALTITIIQPKSSNIVLHKALYAIHLLCFHCHTLSHPLIMSILCSEKWLLNIHVSGTDTSSTDLPTSSAVVPLISFSLSPQYSIIYSRLKIWVNASFFHYLLPSLKIYYAFQLVWRGSDAYGTFHMLHFKSGTSIRHSS